MSEQTSKRARFRLGLTWRVIALTSLVLLGLAALVTSLGHDTLERQFQESRDASHARHHREAELALERAEESLRELAGVVAGAPGLAQALAQGNAPHANQVLRAHWPTLELDAGVEQIRLYREDGTVLAGRGEESLVAPERLDDWLAQVLDTDRPLGELHCCDHCRHYTLLPVLLDGESVGIVMLSRSLADLTRQLHAVTGNDVALLLRGDERPEGADPERWLENWDGQLQAITRQAQTLPQLHQVAEAVEWSALSREPARFEHGDRTVEVHAIPLTEQTESQSGGHLLLVSDISNQLQAIQAHTRNLFFVALAGWVAAEIMLLLILWQPMHRLRRLAQVLPGLASGGFSQARTAIPEQHARLADEIDLLESTTLDLADQLETLEGEVHRRGRQVADQLRALGQERDFIGSLLDTAHVFIVSQDASGRITLVNDYALSTMECSAGDLIGEPFDVAFPGLVPAGRDTGIPHEEERPLQTPGRGERIVAWYHAPLAVGHDEPPGRISVGLDITERKAAEARLTWLAQRDALTGLHNRRYFQETLDRALAKGGRGAVLLADLDKFRDVNELSGHQAGDELLRLVADTLQQNLEHRSVIARLGGDEFALLLEHADADQATQVAQHVARLLEDVGLSIGNQRHRASASIGIVLYPDHGNAPEDVMASADVAMYKAKENRARPWHLLHAIDTVKDELEQRVYWVDQLHQALEGDTFELMVQPIMRLADRSVRHYEVLVRMRNTDQELLMPGRFIPFAEHSGQIVQLDRWVLRAALRLLKRVQADGISLAVNLSGQSLHDDGLTDYLTAELQASGANPHQLILEITETAAVTDFSTARGVLQGIRELGCRTALDDFGVGFSSFHYLGQLPVDYIKIDGSFIRSLTHNDDSRVIVKAIADIAAGFGKEAIAEFVDQEALVPLLQDYRIAFGQGYHLGRPVPVAEAFGGG